MTQVRLAAQISPDCVQRQARVPSSLSAACISSQQVVRAAPRHPATMGRDSPELADLIQRGTGRGSWNPGPFSERNSDLAGTGNTVLQECDRKVVGNTIRSTNNPNKLGKDVGTWSSCYLVVGSALRGTMTLEAEKRIEELQAQLAELRRTRNRV